MHANDFYGWCKVQAALLRAGQFDQVDVENVIEELLSAGRQEREALKNELAALMAYQYELTHGGAEPSAEKRALLVLPIRRTLDENPSLEPELVALTQSAWERARFALAMRGGFDEFDLPSRCPWTFESLLMPPFG